ncbi:hypothetical protein V8G54_031744 [Vigna mungo]|uniref:Uncharacterized protein n=1 Tax=Vigna mungo TaxID=3915 RepID=A0AAQ3MK25_VIGMU
MSPGDLPRRTPSPSRSRRACSYDRWLHLLQGRSSPSRRSARRRFRAHASERSPSTTCIVSLNTRPRRGPGQRECHMASTPCEGSASRMWCLRRERLPRAARTCVGGSEFRSPTLRADPGDPF